MANMGSITSAVLDQPLPGEDAGGFKFSNPTPADSDDPAAYFTRFITQPPVNLHTGATHQTAGITDMSVTALALEPPSVRLDQSFHELASPWGSLSLSITSVLFFALFVRRNPLNVAWCGWWHLLSRLGSAGASMRLADLCRDSRFTHTKPGTPQRDHEVRTYLKRAAKAGNAEAALRLGRSYLELALQHTLGLPRAEHYLRLAAKGGLPEAHHGLGILCQRQGQYTEAYEHFQHAAKAGHVRAMYAAAEVAEQQLLPALGAEAVLGLYRWAADAGSGSAALRLGELFTDGRLTAPNYRQALQWLQSQACRDRWQAHFKIKILQASGFDPDASEEEVIRARLDLATMYWQGKGTGRNPTMATKWALLALDTGDPRAEYLVGKFMLHGVEMLKDQDEARKHLEAAARHGISAAQFELALLLSRPEATTAECELACAWATLAAVRGEPERVVVRDRLAARLDRGACHRANELAHKLAADSEISPPGVPAASAGPWGPGVAWDDGRREKEGCSVPVGG